MNKENVTAGTIARLTEANLIGEPSTVITDISHDSRRVGPGRFWRPYQVQSLMLISLFLKS